MEIKVPKEMQTVQEALFLGLNLRQLIFSALALISSVSMYFIFYKRLGNEMTSWICIMCALPFGAFGFFKYQGMPLERLIKNIFIWFFSPNVLTFKGYNIYKEMQKCPVENVPVKDKNKAKSGKGAAKK